MRLILELFQAPQLDHLSFQKCSGEFKPTSSRCGLAAVSGKRPNKEGYKTNVTYGMRNG